MEQTTSQPYTVKTGDFEGPFDLLLSMIEEKKLPISDISLASVTDEYVSYVQEHKETLPVAIADFIVIASTLLLIKSISLIPHFAVTEEEGKDIKDLESRLEIYRRCKELAIHIEERFGTQTSFFATQRRGGEEILFSPHAMITPETLRVALAQCLAELPIPESLNNVSVRKVVSLEEMITKLYTRIREGMHIGFADFSGHGRGGELSKETRLNVIVSFLALLELVK